MTDQPVEKPKEMVVRNIVDGGKARIILAALVTPSEVMENQPVLDLLWRTRFRWKVHSRQFTGDTTFGTQYFFVGITPIGH